VSSQALQESETTVVHSRFDDGDDGWQASFASPDLGSAQTGSGALCMALDERGENAWDAQLSHELLNLKPGARYALDFRAWASAPTSVRVRVGMQSEPYLEYLVRHIELDVEPQRFVDSWRMGDPDDIAVGVGFQGAGAAARTVPVTVCIDDVHVAER